jgi:release factor glutamine methyltransferase
MPHKKIIDLLFEAEASLRASRVTQTPRLDVEVLLADILNIDRSRLIASYADWLGAHAVERFSAHLQRRLEGEPVAYITGRREFMGLSFLVDSRVLIPRAETETLAEYVLTHAQAQKIERLLDVGTGSGCIAVSLAVLLPELKAHATDVSADALEVARQNARRHGVLPRIHFYEGAFFQPLPDSLRASFQVIVSNPPYIPDYEYPLLQKNVREYEPAAALRGGPNGLDPFRAIVGEAPAWLCGGGLIALEIGEGQSGGASEIMRRTGRLEVIEIARDLAGKPRVIVGRKP